MISSRPYIEIITITRIQSFRSTKVEPSVQPETSNKVQATMVLASDNHAYLKLLQAKFHNRIHKLD